ncbi:MAG TPA: thiopeptide-type bacteriocin biosynthesis protein [Streptosporangiaceae bacterium]
MSLLLCAVLFNAAGLDSFEQADTWHRVAQMRLEPGSNPARLTGKLRALLPIPITADAPAFRPQHPAASAAPWASAFSDAGHQLRQHAARGGRGLRSILAHIVIFHWNRLGLPASTQATLAHAARRALLPAD